MANSTPRIPRIDPKVRFVGISFIRKINAKFVSNIEETYVLSYGDEPLAVLIPYATYMRLQEVAEQKVRENV